MISGVLIVAILTSLIFLHLSERHVHNYRRRHMINLANKVELKIKSEKRINLSDNSFLKYISSNSKEAEDRLGMPYLFSFINNDKKLKKKNVIREIPDGRLWLVNVLF